MLNLHCYNIVVVGIPESAREFFESFLARYQFVRYTIDMNFIVIVTIIRFHSVKVN